MPDGRRPLWTGVLAAAAAVSLTTAVVYPLREVATDLSLSVVYMLAVLFIASAWGAWLGIATALASALAFNYFHIPPTGRFTIADGENWIALVVFLIAAIATSALADAARSRALEADQRRREADLSAEMSRTLLRGDNLREALPVAAQRLAASLELASAAIELKAVEGPFWRVGLLLGEEARRTGATSWGSQSRRRTILRGRGPLPPPRRPARLLRADSRLRRDDRALHAPTTTACGASWSPAAPRRTSRSSARFRRRAASLAHARCWLGRRGANPLGMGRDSGIDTSRPPFLTENGLLHLHLPKRRGP